MLKPPTHTHTHSNPDPGEHGFKILNHEGAKTRPKSDWPYLTELETLLVKPKCDFPVTYMAEKPLPSSCHVRTMVYYKHVPHIQRHSPVTKGHHHLAGENNECMPLGDHRAIVVKNDKGCSFSHFVGGKRCMGSTE